MQRQTREVERDLDECLRAIISRSGIGLAAFMGAEWLFPGEGLARPVDVAHDLHVSNFRIGKTEEIGDRKTQSFSYRLMAKLGAREVEISVTLWIDLATALPVKRILEGGVIGDKKLRIEESYSKITLDEAIAPTDFTVR
jgi:hypothetical protein